MPVDPICPLTVHLLVPGPCGEETCDTDGTSAREDRALSFFFNGQTSVITQMRTVRGQDFLAVQDTAARLQLAHDLMFVHTALHRRAANSPARLGLVPVRLPRVGNPSNLTWMIDRRVSTQELARTVPPAYWDGQHGWFAANADPEAFGTLYLAPTGDVDPIWGLYQVGMDEQVAHARWDDAVGVAGIAARCEEDPDLMLTMRALQNSSVVADAATAHAYRTAVLEARAVFAPKARQVRPRLTDQAVDTVRRELFSDSYWKVRGGVLDLRPYQVFGYHEARENPMVYGAYSVGFRDPIADETVHAFAQRLQELLAPRSLGTVTVVTMAGTSTIWVSRDAALLERHAVAFDIEAGSVFTVVSPTAVSAAA